jgi:hypothetical protein
MAVEKMVKKKEDSSNPRNYSPEQSRGKKWPKERKEKLVQLGV